MAQELLLEIGTEEIPAGYIDPALNQLKEILAERLAALFLPYESMRTGGTPKRLTLVVSGLVEKQPDRNEEIMGPSKKAAYDVKMQPTPAVIGFVKSKGARLEDISIVDTPKGEYVMLQVNKKGFATFELLSEILPAAITSLRFPKSMRWGRGRIPFARPIQTITALYGGQIIPFSINDIESGNLSRGHRFMAPASFPVQHFATYRDELRSRFVLLDGAERQEIVLRESRTAALVTGGKLLEDDQLAETVANLIEYPFPICGSFERRFLALPKEVLITSMREHQKYFAVVDDNEALLPYFVAVNNTNVMNREVAAAGHQRVLRARLEDALFFFEEDKKKTLADRSEGLAGIVFQAKLGTMQEKVTRIVALVAKMAAQIAPGEIETCRRAAFLCKADLLTNMVNEFPTLQGIMGREYAMLDKESATVALAIHEHYLPVRAGGSLPQSQAGALVGLADRLDTIVGCFGIGQSPTGAADPYGLRRLALGFISIVVEKGLRFSLRHFIREAIASFGSKLTVAHGEIEEGVLNFIKGRFQNELTGRGISPETVEAVLAVTFDDIHDCRLRVEALSAIQDMPTFRLLAGSFKRVMNIIKEQQAKVVDQALLQVPAERNLYAALAKVAGEVKPLLEERQYQRAMESILSMKEPIDLFFDDVMVMTDDVGLRNNRVALLANIAQLFLAIGDFSKMYAIV